MPKYISFAAIPVAGCVFFWACLSSVAADSPSLSHVFPAGAQRGARVTVRCFGEFEWPPKVWAPGVEVKVLEEPKLELAIPPRLATDRVWLRLYNAHGASQLVPFMIGSLPETEEVEPNDGPQTAQRLADVATPPNDARLTVNGVLQKNDDVDGFAVRLVAGQTLVAALNAHELLGSPMDAILQVVTRDGIVVAENHDAVGLDPRLTFTARTSGTYVVRLFAFPSTPDQRIQFRGGEAYVYRLTLTTGPFLTHVAGWEPAADDRSASVTPRGWNLPPGFRLPVLARADTDDARSEHRSLLQGQSGFVWCEGWAGSVRTAGFGDRPFMSDRSGEIDLPVPGVVHGRLVEREATDSYQIQLCKDQPIHIQVAALQMHSDLVPHVKLMDPGGKVAVESGESGPDKDTLLQHQAATAGRYRLTVRDRYGQGGARCFYRLTVAPQQTDFELSLDRDTVSVTPAKPTEVNVAVTRHSVDEPLGEILIECVDLPDSITATPVVSLAEGETSSKVVLKLETCGEPFSGPFRIRGTAKDSGLQRYARTPAVHHARFTQVWITAQGDQ